jgi:hypothetical protein
VGEALRGRATLVVRTQAQRHRDPLVWLGLLGLAVAVYLPYALKGGWYYDDWAIYEPLHHITGGWADRFDSCATSIPGGRKLTCLYHVTLYQLLGDHRTAYHLVAIGFLVAMAGLTYAILRRCRLPWGWAALAAALLIVFPASDSTRLWPTGAIGQYVIVLELLGVLLALIALDRRRGWLRIALHVFATVLFLLAMVTYEIAVPLVALNGIVYWAAYRNRAALWRGAADLALALGFVFYRLAIDPVDPDSGFSVHRTLHGDLSRARTLVEGAWSTWHETFLGGALGTIGIAVVLATAAFLALRDRGMRRRLLPWFGLLAGAVAVAVASTFVFFTANDLYVPQIDSAFNRVTLPASIAYVCLFVALLGLGYEIVRHFTSRRLAAALAVAAVVCGSAWHQLQISSEHKRLWEASWSEQEKGLEGYAVAVRGIPPKSRVVGMGVPIWEPGFVPVFSASWDLSAALRYTTGAEPTSASPLTPTMVCGVRGLVLDGAPYTPYRVPGEPLYFLDASRRAAAPVGSQGACKRTIARWGRPAFIAPPAPS